MSDALVREVKISVHDDLARGAYDEAMARAARSIQEILNGSYESQSPVWFTWLAGVVVFCLCSLTAARTALGVGAGDGQDFDNHYAHYDPGDFSSGGFCACAA